jgi:hypothetical protein
MAEHSLQAAMIKLFFYGTLKRINKSVTPSGGIAAGYLAWLSARMAEHSLQAAGIAL